MLKILYAEFDATHRENFVFDIPQGQDSWLLLLTQTPAMFLVDNVLTTTPPNTVILYKPEQPIYYRACESRYSNDWIRFRTDEAFVTKTIIPRGVPFNVQDPLFLHKLFQLITSEHEREDNTKEAIVEMLLEVMFLKLSETFESKTGSIYYRNINELRNQIHKKPGANWTVNGIAETLNMSVGHLEKIYKSTYGVTCMEDVISSRIHLAKKYLKNGELSITEIIHRCGYRNAEHFYRQFKKNTGMTPKNYRQQHIHISIEENL